MKALAEAGEGGSWRLVDVHPCRHDGQAFQAIVTEWLATARDPRFGKPYTELAYEPMLELLAYLARQRVQDLHRLGRRRSSSCGPGRSASMACRRSRSSGRRSRPNSRCATDSRTLFRLPEVNFIDDKAGKPVGINAVHRPQPDRRLRQFGRRPGDAAVDDDDRRPRAGPYRPPHRRRSGIRL